VYRGSAIPGLRGYYLFADYCSGRVWFVAGPHRIPHILTGISRKLRRTSLVRAGRQRRALPVEPERGQGITCWCADAVTHVGARPITTQLT